jgi:hypothetical protein
MQFDAIDGGERASNNPAYYFDLGISNSIGSAIRSIEMPTGSSKYMFSNNSPNQILWIPKIGFSSATFYAGMRTNVTDLGAITTISFRNINGNAQIELLINTDGSLSIVSGSTTLGRSGPSLIIPNTNQYIEVFGVISATVGQTQVRLNGNPTAVAGLTLTNVNTANDTSSLPVTNILFSYSGSPYLAVRDLYIHDGTGTSPFNTFLGNVGCEWLPVASLVSAAFSPIGGTNLTNAASTPPNPTADYNQSSTVGALDKFGITALPSDVASVIAVAAVDYSYKSDTGPRALQKTLFSGTATSVGTETYLNESPTCNQDPWVVQDPNTSANWTNAAVNALDISYEIAA